MTVRSVIHIVLLLSIASWGLFVWPLPLPGVAISLGMFVLALLLWALFLSPKPVLAADKFGRSFVELLLIAGAVASLLAIGVDWVVAALLGAVAVTLSFLALRQD